ncbi:MAG: hypothetical protein ABR607_07385 [Pyrinomonadaceae bacterium]
MTNSTSTSIHRPNEVCVRANNNCSDAAPMVITRLSGWIDVSEIKAESRAWIVPTRIQQSVR